MAIYAIADLHLSLSANKPMDVFGDQWAQYMEKIESAWRSQVTDDDAVLIAGDISWAMHFADAAKDLDWIDALPGVKFLIKGNHDYWWASLKKMNNKWPTLHFIHNNYFEYETLAICGSRGWTVPNPKEFTTEDNRIYQREILRLQISLDQAVNAGHEDIVCMIHYPPLNESCEANELTAMLKKYPVKQVVYGHLHTEEGFKIGPKGTFEEIEFILTSCDFLDFKPKRIR